MDQSKFRLESKEEIKLQPNLGEKKNTIRTNGEGGIDVVLGAVHESALDLLHDAVVLHEQSHAEDIIEFGSNLEILNTKVKDLPIVFKSRIANAKSELKGFQIEIGVLLANKKRFRRKFSRNRGALRSFDKRLAKLQNKLLENINILNNE